MNEQRPRTTAFGPDCSERPHASMQDGFGGHDEATGDDLLLVIAASGSLRDDEGKPVSTFPDAFHVVKSGSVNVLNDDRLYDDRIECTAHFPIPSPLFPNPGERLNQFGTKSSQNLTNGKWRTNTTRRKTVIQLVRVSGYSSIATEQVLA